MTEFVQIYCTRGAGKGNRLKGIRYKFQTDKKNGKFKLCLTVGSEIQEALNVKPKDRACISYSRDNVYEVKIEKQKEGEVGGYAFGQNNSSRSLYIQLKWDVSTPPAEALDSVPQLAPYVMHDGYVIFKMPFVFE